MTNCSGASTGQPSKKRLKPSGQAGVKTNKRGAAKQKRKGGNVAKDFTKRKKKCRFEVVYSQVEDIAKEPVIVAEILPVDTDDSDIEVLDKGAEDELHRMLFLQAQAKVTKNRIMLEVKKKKISSINSMPPV